MIKFIAAIDENRGLANEKGIPWLGKIPSDMENFRTHTIHGTVIMGFRTYEEFGKPLSDRRNLVITRPGTPLKPGFEVIENPREFLQNATEDIWVVGGAAIYGEFLDLADELYLTRLQAAYPCTKFFPEFEDFFQIVNRGEDITENGITYHFETWIPR